MTHFPLAALAALIATPVLAEMQVEIPFAAEMAGQPFTCAASFAGVGTTQSTVQFGDFRLFVSNVRLIGAEGAEVPVTLAQDGIWQLAGTALIDFEDATGACANGTAETNTTLRGTAPEGSYTGLAFDIGVPFAQNHGDPTLAASPLNLTAMFWTWAAGYKFIKIDLATSGQPLPAPMKAAMDGAADHSATMKDGPKGWALHLGSTGCASDSKTTAPAADCANPNRVAVRLDGFVPGTGHVLIDPAPVLAGANVDVNAPETAAGCMSFPKDGDCPPVMSALGLGYDGTPAVGVQQMFSLR
jgi:uncharacterized repeat protein (TIGR04052 family)